MLLPSRGKYTIFVEYPQIRIYKSQPKTQYYSAFPTDSQLATDTQKTICDSADKFEDTLITIFEPFKIDFETCIDWAAYHGYSKILKYLEGIRK